MISSTRRAAVLLVGTFVLGAAVGAAATSYASGDGSSAPRSRGAWYLDHLTKNLHLSTVQRDSVKAAIDRYTPAMDTLMGEIRPRLDTVRAAMRADIAQFLDDTQRKEYEAMQREHERERKAGGSNAR